MKAQACAGQALRRALRWVLRRALTVGSLVVVEIVLPSVWAAVLVILAPAATVGAFALSMSWKVATLCMDACGTSKVTTTPTTTRAPTSLWS